MNKTNRATLAGETVGPLGSGSEGDLAAEVLLPPTRYLKFLRDNGGIQSHDKAGCQDSFDLGRRPIGKALFQYAKTFRNKSKLESIQVPNDEIKKCVECIIALSEVYRLHGIFPKVKRHDKIYIDACKKALLRVLHFVEMNGRGSWIKYFKYKLCAKFAAEEAQELPVRPDGIPHDDLPKVILAGPFRWKEQIMSAEKRKSLAYSILMAKKGFPRATEDLISAAEVETMTKLCSHGPDDPTDLFMTRIDGSTFQITREIIEQQIDRTCEELFEGKKFTPSMMSEPSFPSTSGNYINSRNKMGAVALIMDEIMRPGVANPLFDLEKDAFNLKDYPFAERPTELLKMSYQNVTLKDEFSSYYGKRGEEEDAMFQPDNIKNTIGIEVDDTRLREEYRALYWKLFKYAIDEKPLVKPVGLAEALKIRVISKGPPLLYTVLKPLQRFMWETLSQNKVFELIGKPVNEEIITNLFTTTLDPTKEIISGDYKASTDNIRRWVSERVARAISKKLRENFMFSPSLEMLFVRALTEHIFEDENGFLFNQREGQLMGSIVSFPPLCIANAALCRYAMEISDGVRYRLTNRPTPHNKGRLCPLRVNGDDCVFWGNKKFIRDNWLAVTKFAGLESSVGKTYFSQNFAVINSELYDYIPEKVCISKDPEALLEVTPAQWKLRKYVNMGLVYGIKRSEGSGVNKGKQQQRFDLGALHSELYRTCPEELWPDANSSFIYHNMRDLKQLNLPWFLPTWAGGIGLVATSRSCVTTSDLRCLEFLKRNIHLYPRVGKIMEPNMWKMHNFVLDRLQYGLGNTFFRKYVDGGLVDQKYKQVYKLATIELLFTKQKKDIIDGKVSESKVSGNQLAYNRRVWSQLRKLLQDGKITNEPFPFEELAHEKKEGSIPFYVLDTQH